LLKLRNKTARFIVSLTINSSKSEDFKNNQIVPLRRRIARDGASRELFARTSLYRPIDQIAISPIGRFVYPIFQDHYLSRQNANALVSRFSGSEPMGNTVRRLLKENYGSRLSNRIIERYGFTKKASFSWRDIESILIGVGANVQLSDLKALFRQIKGDFSSGMGCIEMLSQNELEDLGSVGSFDQLSEMQIETLLKPFRAMPWKILKEVPSILPSYRHHDEINVGLIRFSGQVHDELLLNFMTSMPTRANQRHLDASLSEYLAKDLAYAELEAGMILPLWTSQGKLCHMEVIGTLQQSGMIATLLKPIVPQPGEQSLHLMFRGTQWQPARRHSFYTLMRVTDSSGVGRAVFESAWPAISNMIKEAIGHYRMTDVCLSIHGHSLGAVDAQRATAAVIHEMASSPKTALRVISSIFSYAHNSPGIEGDLNARFARDLQMLDQNEISCPVDQQIFSFPSDPVELAGEMYLGAGVENPLFYSRVHQLEHPKIRGFALHNERGFFNDPYRPRYMHHAVQDEQLMIRGYDQSKKFSIVKTIGGFFYNRAKDVVYLGFKVLALAGHITGYQR